MGGRGWRVEGGGWRSKLQEERLANLLKKTGQQGPGREIDSELESSQELNTQNLALKTNLKCAGVGEA